MNKSNEETIRRLQECHDTNPILTEEHKQAIQDGIAAIRKDQLMEAVIKLAPVLGSEKR
ncbi:MAG TPA: hypothetical protein VGN00_18900 [Puia sp.]|jgi:hypothetical protein